MHQDLTYICVYNNENQLNSMLKASLDKLDDRVEYNAILINNSFAKYHSCSEAYNTELEINEARLGNILIFVHQDIAFNDNNLQKRIISELKDNPNQILGVAGMSKEGRTLSNLKYLKTGNYITITQIADKTEVESLDECCFAMTKDLYFKLKFDEKTCSHWHLYAVDLCYEAKRKYGIKSFVLPESIFHKMDGSSGLTVERHFLWTIYKMTRKYHKIFSEIYTPCYIVSTYLPKTILKISRSLIKNIFSGKG